jgi:peroxiredoxin
MNFRTLFIMLTVLCLFANVSTAQRGSNKSDMSIVIQVELPNDFEKESTVLEYMPYNIIRPEWKIGKPEIKGNLMKWSFHTEDAILIRSKSIPGISLIRFYERGDSIHIDFTKGINREIYSGRGADKFTMQQEIFKRQSLVLIPKNRSFTRTVSLDDYSEWNNYLNAKLEIINAVMTTYEAKITSLAYGYLRAKIISEIEYQRGMKFGDMVYWPTDKRISGEELGKIFDTTVLNKYSKWLQNYRGNVSNSYYFYDFVRKSMLRKYNFNTDHIDLAGPGRKVLYADLAKQIYSGVRLQDFFAWLLTESGLKEHTYGDKEQSPEIEHLLKEFYETSGYPEYKAYVKDYEQMIREWVISIGHNAPDFSLEDVSGKLITKKELSGKLVVLSFLDYTAESLKMTTALKKVHQTFEGNPNVVFVNISVEKNKTRWKKSLSDAGFEMKSVVNLYTNGQGKAHLALKYYNVRAYPEFGKEAFPRVFVLNGEGKFVFNGEFMRANGGPLERITYRVLPDPRDDSGIGLNSEIYKQLALINDGPYVFYEKSGIKSYSIHSSKAVKQDVGKNGVKLTAGTDDLRKTFPMQRRSKMILEPSVTSSRPQKLFVLSDIEGNFEAFRKLLQANKVIDHDFNWIFGKNHLVFAGDMFDRGLQVTECLWLVYMLEEKAKGAGGYVHFILGNHEIMNLQGDHRYVEDKYKENAALMGKTLTQLYNDDSELGRWLRTKNIVEKIGDLLFAHGGISRELNQSTVTIEEINQLARPYYAENKKDYGNQQLNTIMSNTVGPFWYRGYYGKVPVENVVDSTLQKFNVKHIITGHTIIADTITTHYNNKVINTDTKHKNGKSEALLIEGNNFYRVNAEGRRVLLFKDEEKK